MIERDFAFHGNSAPNELRNYHDHGPGRRTTGITRTKRHTRARRSWADRGTIGTTRTKRARGAGAGPDTRRSQRHRPERRQGSNCRHEMQTKAGLVAPEARIAAALPPLGEAGLASWPHGPNRLALGVFGTVLASSCDRGHLTIHVGGPGFRVGGRLVAAGIRGLGRKSSCRAGCGARAWRPCAPQPACHRIDRWCCSRWLRRTAEAVTEPAGTRPFPHRSRNHGVVRRLPGISRDR